MDLTPYYGSIVIIATAIYMAVGYYFKGLKQGEAFDIMKCLETVVLVVLLVITGLMSGVTVTAEWINTLLGTLGQNPFTITIILSALIGLIDQFVKSGGKLITGTIAPAAAAAATNLITVTGPWDGGTDPNSKADNISSRIGTRVIMNDAGAFQLIDDRIARDFIVGGSGKNAGASGVFKFTGNLAAITHGALI